MEIIADDYKQLCSYENIFRAYEKARKHKTQKPYVIEFEKNLITNLFQLRTNLLFHAYAPQLLQTFVIRDPKTRKISKSAFPDRIVHHAIGNIIEERFEKRFIYDSYANRKGKGTLKAIERFDYFKRKISKNYTQITYVLKADIRHYFETVDHEVLFYLLKKKIGDKRLLGLIQKIVQNHKTAEKWKGMPLGNLTSQFFANIYLHELDIFVKHTLKAKYYIRYVDDFVIFNNSRQKLEEYKERIDFFLRDELKLALHPDKSRILLLENGIEFLGMKIFQYHRRVKKKNLRKFRRKFADVCLQYDQGDLEYDTLYDFLEGWLAYAAHANTYNLRKGIIESVENKYPQSISTKEVSRLEKNSKMPSGNY